MRHLGGLYREQGNYAQAEALLREALRGFLKTRPDFWARFEIESTLGASLSSQRKFAEAEPLLLSGYEGLTRLKATIPPLNKSSLDHAGDWIVTHYQNWGRPEKVDEWRRKLQKS